MLRHHLTLHHHIIYIDLDTLAQLRFKHSSHHSSIGRPCIFQTKGHHFVMVISCRGDKSYLFLIIQSQWYLVVSLEGIQKTHPMVAYNCIH